MSTNRLGDRVAATALHIAQILATGGSRPIAGLSAYRAAQASLGVMGVAGGGGADTLDIKLQESDPPAYLNPANGYDGTDDGSEKLRDGAASNLLFAIPFTPPVDLTIYCADLWLSRLGVIAAGESVWASIDTDAAGDPAGVYVSGAQGIDESRRIAGASVPTAITQERFFFEDGIDLVGLTPYWLVLNGDITVSAVNCIQAHYNTVVGTSGCKYFDAAWAAMANNDLWCRIMGLSFTDITDGAFAQVVEGWLNAIDTAQRIELDLQTIKDVVRAYYTVSGGTWDIGNILNVGFPIVGPMV